MSIDDDDEYEVGYGKPPEHTRFQKGHSGNPRGRPKGTNNFRTDLLTTLKASVKVTRDGKPRKVSTQEAALLRLREQALGGNTRALDRLLGLAQIHNNEETGAASASSEGDAELLELFRSRILSGAADDFSSPEKRGCDDLTPKTSKDVAAGTACNDLHHQPADAEKPEDSSD